MKKWRCKANLAHQTLNFLRKIRSARMHNGPMRNRRSVGAGATRRAGLVGRLWDEVPRQGRDDRQRHPLTALVET